MCLLLPMLLVAQPKVGFLELKGQTAIRGKGVPNVNITLKDKDKVVQELTSDAKGRFSLNISFGPDYTLHFTSKEYLPTFLTVETASVPEGSTFIAALYKVEPFMILRNSPNFPVYLFDEAFARIKYTGKKSFDNDIAYSDAFQEKIDVALRDANSGKTMSTEGMVIAGKVINLSATGGPLKFKVIHLKNVQGEVIQSFVTNEEGAFVFTKLPGDQSFLLSLDEEDVPFPDGSMLAVTDARGRVVQKTTKKSGTPTNFDFSDPYATGSSRMYTLEKNYTINIKGQDFNPQQAHEQVPQVNFRLVDQQGQVLHSTGDTNALISFIKLLASNDYFQRVDEQNRKIIEKTTLVIQDSNGKILKELRLDELEKFNYSLLPSDKIKLVIVKTEESEMLIAGNIVYGEDPSRPFAFKRLLIIDNQGNLIESAVTNEFGSFIFTRLKPEQQFILRVAEEDAHSEPIEKFTLTNSENEEVMAVFGDQQGHFEFLFSTNELPKIETLKVKPELMRTRLKGYLKWSNGINEPLSNEAITIKGSDGFVRRIQTSADGRFHISNLPSNQAFVLSTDALKGSGSVGLYNEQSQLLINTDLDPQKRAQFDLAPSQITLLGAIYIADPWIDLLETEQLKIEGTNEMVIAENIYFAVNDFQMQPSFKKLLNKVLEVMNKNKALKLELSSHTDSRGSDEYNRNLSEKRAATARAYLISRGINEDRIISKGYGESRLINRCSNGVDCSEEEHAQNRRVEFKMLFD